MFDLDVIKSETNLATLEFHREIGSTNDRAIKAIKQSELAMPALILAQFQTAGRGQRSHKWWSGQGSLTFSYIHDCSSIHSPITSLATAIVVAEALESQTELQDVKIKWPNDILVGGRKIAGILIESIPHRQKFFTVIGIGINANNQAVSKSELEELDQNAKHSILPTSVQIETGNEASLQSLLIDLTQRLEQIQSSTEQVVDQVNDRLAMRHQQVCVSQPGKSEFTGICKSVLQDGRLSIEISPDAVPVKLTSGTIRPLGT